METSGVAPCRENETARITRYIAVVAGVAALALLLIVLSSTAAQAQPKFNPALKTGEKQMKVIDSLGMKVSYNLTVTNVGSAMGVTDLVLVNLPKGWDSTQVPSPCCGDGIGPGKMANVTLYIFAAPDALNNTYIIKVTAKVSGSPQLPAGSELQLKVVVPQWACVAVTAPPPKGGEPGQTLVMPFRVTNCGNGGDKFQITTLNIGDSNWDISVVGGQNITDVVKPGQSVEKQIQVTIPWDAKATGAGESGVPLTVGFTSWFDMGANPEYAKTDVNSTYISVGGHPGPLGISMDQQDRSAMPGERIDFTFNVSNSGNVDDIVNVSFSFDYPLWTMNPQSRSMPLPAYGVGRNRVTFIPPPVAVASTYTATITITSYFSTDENPIKESATVGITVLQIFAVEILPSGAFSSELVIPGQETQFLLNVKNGGNGPDSVNLSAALTSPKIGWVFAFDPAVVTLDPFQSTQVSFKTRPSTDPAQSPVGPQTLKVTAASQNLNVTSTLELTVNVDKVRGVDLTLVGDPLTDVDPYYKGGRGSFFFTLRNTGNSIDDLSVELVSGDTFIGNIYPAQVTLDAGVEAKIKLDVQVLPGMEMRMYSLTVMSRSQTDVNKTSRQITVTVAVVSMDLIMQSLEINNNTWKEYPTQLNTQLFLTANVYNNGSGAVRNVVVKFYDNDNIFYIRNITTLGAGRIQKITVQWNASEIGNHLIRAEASSGAGDRSPPDNRFEAIVKVSEHPGGDITGRSTAAFDPVPLLVIVLITVAVIGGGIAYSRRRRAQPTKEVYDSIYGTKEDQDKQMRDVEAQMATEQISAVERSAKLVAQQQMYGKPGGDYGEGASLSPYAGGSYSESYQDTGGTVQAVPTYGAVESTPVYDGTLEARSEVPVPPGPEPEAAAEPKPAVLKVGDKKKPLIVGDDQKKPPVIRPK